jgi:hypothetical protein
LLSWVQMIVFKLTGKTVHEITELEEAAGMFSVFADAELSVSSFSSLYDFVSEYMPASIEITQPQMIQMKAADAAGTLNDYIARVHQTDMYAKELTQKYNILARDMSTMIKNGIQIYVSTASRTPAQIAAAVGVDIKQLDHFLQQLIADNKIVEKEGKYAIRTA